MSNSSAYSYGREALEFIDRLKGMNDAQAIVNALGQQLTHYGFHSWLITGLPEIGDRIEPLVILNGWAPGWYDLYKRENFSDYDPCVARCKASHKPFTWDEVAVTDRRSEVVMQRAADFGMRTGMCVPIHDETGFRAVVTMAGRTPDVSKAARSAINLIALFAHSRASAVQQPTPLRHKQLSVREREVLTWTAMGRTSDEIGDTLGIAEGTVKVNLRNAARKLGTRGKMRTVVEAYQRSEIALG